MRAVDSAFVMIGWIDKLQLELWAWLQKNIHSTFWLRDVVTCICP